MSSMAVFSHGSSSPPRPLISFNRPRLRRFTSFNVSLGPFSDQTKFTLVPHFFKPSTFRKRSFQGNVAENSGDAGSINDIDEKNSVTDDLIVNQENQTTIITSSFLVKLAIAVGVAGIFTVASVSLRQPVLGSLLGVQILADSSSASVSALSSLDFAFKAFGYRIVLPAHAPGWIYFWLLMAAGCGLFISEEALNIWVGITLARLLSLDGTWHSFVESFSRNAPYILSTFLWVYWGVCISDMIPFYLGKMFSQTKASQDVCSKLGIGKERASNITRTVQRYGNFIGFVERFSLGVRNPTAFLAGALGVSPECFFAGVCFGGLITLPLQLGIGFLLRERPVFALATVATAVGTWTVFPYLVAASTALFLFLRRRYST